MVNMYELPFYSHQDGLLIKYNMIIFGLFFEWAVSLPYRDIILFLNRKYSMYTLIGYE